MGVAPSGHHDGAQHDAIVMESLEECLFDDAILSVIGPPPVREARERFEGRQDERVDEDSGGPTTLNNINSGKNASILLVVSIEAQLGLTHLAHSSYHPHAFSLETDIP